MPRPERIEYEGAFHHVMNRGRSRQDIFHGDGYYHEFLKLLADATKRFDAVIHAYCLMTNHYHLLIETPQANLSRIMRHINGVYTQKYNWLNQSDGSLFKGRYKSILVDQDDYLLQLSRYIHRNPIDTETPMVKDLAEYPWSSYAAYINQSKAPEWLYREQTYQMLGQKQRYKGYEKYVLQGVDEDIKRYYGKHNVLSILGDASFREMAIETREETDIHALRQALANRPETEEVIRLVARMFKVEPLTLTNKRTGKRRSNPLRAFAMYACQYYGGNRLVDIGEAFQLSNIGSASFSINKIKREIELGSWLKERKALEKLLVW